jgi:tetratricopeptide (TPR) repeat protein
MALAALVLPLTSGCQSVKPREKTLRLGSTSSHTPPGSTSPRTDFRKDVGPEQRFNMHLELARAHESTGNVEAAVIEYQKAIEVCEKKGSLFGGSELGSTQRALAQRRMAAALDRLGRFAQAETHYQSALKLAPKDPKVWNDVGYSYYLQNRLADAERAFKTAAKIEPNDPRVLTNLGLTLAASGKNTEALAALSRAAGPAVGNANLGYILAAMGRSEEARKHYETALAHQPELTPARRALAALDARGAGTTLPKLPDPSLAQATASSSAPSDSGPTALGSRPTDSEIRRTSTDATGVYSTRPVPPHRSTAGKTTSDP